MFFYCVNFETRIYAVVSDNQNHIRPSRRSTKKKSRISPTACSVTISCTRHDTSGHCTDPKKPGRFTRHINKNNGQTKDGGKGKPVNELHEKKNKHYLYLQQKRKIYICVILDTHNNNTQIHTVKTRITHNGGSKVLSRRKQANEKI